MRRITARALVACSALLAPACARACEPIVAECLPRLAVFPAYTADGARIGTVTAPVRQLPPAEESPTTGQPLAVIYNNPGRLPDSVDPFGDLVPLPRAAPSRTRGAYPKGY